MSDLFVGLATGQRVAVRSRISPPPHHGPRLTDTVGDLVAVDEASLRIATRRGEVLLPRDLIVATRVIPPRPTRRGAAHRAISIEDLHLIMTCGQPGLEQDWLGDPGRGWLLRAGHGWTGRSNSVLPIGSPGLPMLQAIKASEAWYRQRGLSSLVMLPRPRGAETREDPLGGLLITRGYREGTIAEVMTAQTESLVTAAVASPPGLTMSTRPHPDEDWLRAGSRRLLDHLDTARQILAVPREQVFLTAYDSEGVPIAVARVAINDGWAGIFGMHVTERLRQRGIGRWLMHTAARAALDAGASLAYLQVEQGNAAAQSLYLNLGFTIHHEYVYLGRPQPPVQVT